MDRVDAEKYAHIFTLLAEILERPREAESEKGMSYALGDLARRLFVGTRFDPPDELLEQAAHALRQGQAAERAELADRLREHAAHLLESDSN